MPPSNQVRTTRGSISSIFTYVFLFFLIWVEIGGYIDGFIDYQFSVDDVIRTNLFLNMDITVASPCKSLQVDVRDSTADRMLAEEKLNFQGLPNAMPWEMYQKTKEVVSPKLEDILANSLGAKFVIEGQRQNDDLPYCRIFGTLPVNRVRGSLYITGKGFGSTFLRSQPQTLNFTHQITEFSFGDFYPYFDNPLDMTYQVTEENAHTFQYKLSVIPTQYEKLGVDIDTTQYAMSLYESSRKYVSGIFVQYDFEPIKMIVAERRLSFWHFLIKLVTIIGGIWIVCKWCYRVLEKLLTVALGKDVLRRGEEKKEGGLLDSLDEETFEKI